MARAKKQEEATFKEFKFDGEELQFTGRIYPDKKTETSKCDITPMTLTINGVITIKGCRLFQSDKNSWIAWPGYKSGDEYKSYIWVEKEYNNEMAKLVEAIEQALEA